MEAAGKKGRGGKKKGEESDDGFHFIAYVPVNGILWELDGLRRQPLKLGFLSSHALAAFFLTNGRNLYGWEMVGISHASNTRTNRTVCREYLFPDEIGILQRRFDLICLLLHNGHSLSSDLNSPLSHPLNNF